MKTKKILSFVLVGIIMISIITVFSSKSSISSAKSSTGAEITVDLADRSLGEIYHGASAALYGLSEPNVPDINTLIPIKPSHILQKAPNGVQHPSGDGLRVADYFFESGGNNIQIYMQDYYGRWYYPSRSPEEYIEEAIIPVTNDIKAYKDKWGAENKNQDPDEKFIYVPYNEPEQNRTRYPEINAENETGAKSRETFNNDWLAVYNAIKTIDPGAQISGPNLINYKPAVFESFISFCIENDCLPDTISWHLLSSKSYMHAEDDLETYRALEEKYSPVYAEKYPDRKSPFPIKVDINEYASPAEIAVGGSLIQYLARYDELKVTGALPYWNTANSYGSLLAGQNEPNGAWWLYKWYADMEGDMAKVNVKKANSDGDTYGPGLYGLSTIDDNKKQVNIVFGGNTGESNIVFNNVKGTKASPNFLEGSDKVHMTVWRAGYTGLTGFLAEPIQVVDRNVEVVNGSVTLSIETDNMSTYYAVMTEAVDSTTNTTWFNRYEAENAEVRNNVLEPTSVYPRNPRSDRSASNGQYVGGIDYSDSVVKFTNITVPENGNYKLDIIEGSGSTASLPAQSGNEESNQRQTSEYFVKIDDQPSFKVELGSDYSYEQLGMVTQFIDLTAGNHSVSISKYNQDTGEMGQGAATLDAIELTYNGELGAKPNYRVQAEFADYDYESGLLREDLIKGFEGAGYVTGYNNEPKQFQSDKEKQKSSETKTQFVMSVQNDGMYDVTVRYATKNAGKLVIDLDNQEMVSHQVKNSKGQWQDETVRMFLRKGINLIDVRSENNLKLSLDYIDATFVDDKPIIAIEAEDATIVGTPAEGDPSLIRNDVFAENASGEKYVNGITSYDGKERYLELSTVDVPEAGNYKLAIRYANGEYAGTHSYNNNVVERYAQVSVNGSSPKTVYFKNTISWQQYATLTIDVKLQKGKNTIKFSNNNTYDGGSNPYGGSNASGTAPFVDTTMVPKQYTPAFDKFEIYSLPTVIK